MQRILGESFDRYGRYSHVWSIRQTCLPDRPIRILDVGDPYGIVGLLFPDDQTVSIDFTAEPRPGLTAHAQLLGSGLNLPFGDGTFDLVTSQDALEHVPGDLRPSFIDELVRVSGGPVVLGAPFWDPRTVRCEQMVNAFYVARFGHSMVQLDEHAANRLPELDAIESILDQRGLAHVAFGDGWLYLWLGLMLVKAALVSEGDEDTNRQLDIACNQLLGDVDHRVPHYRRTIVIRPPDNVELAGLPALVPSSAEEVATDLAQLMELGVDIEGRLPRYQPPFSAGSPLARWIESKSTESGAGGEVARTLAAVIDRIRPDSGTGLAADDAAAVDPTAGATTSVSIVIVNLNGADHLPPLLESLNQLDYPRHLLEVIVVDNGSTDPSREILAEHPEVVVLAQDHNLGFAPAVNVGVRAARGECVVLLNNDMRVAADFLRQLVASYDPDSGYVCVAATILSWDGELLDFGEGSVNFYGFGGQIGYGTPIASVDLVDGQELLFACGGAMLVSKAIYDEIGGLDDAFFAYFEDVDFGWRLRLSGYRVRLAAKAHAFHRMHGTSSRFPLHQRLFLYERNALRAVIKNYDDDNLPRVLAPALLLIAARTQLRAPLDRAAFEIGGDNDEFEYAPRLALSHLHAVIDVVENIDELLDKRAKIQAARVVSDEEVAKLFGRTFDSVHPDATYKRLQDLLVETFALDEKLPHERVHQVVVITAEPLGEKMRGPAVRATELARALAGDAYVTLLAPAPADLEVEGVEVVTFASERELLEVAGSADVVILQGGFLLHGHPDLAHIEGLLVADIYDPWLFENLELYAANGEADLALRRDVTVLNELLDAADFFICASERQRDYWLGMLAARGRLDKGAYDADSRLRTLIDVVPFGLPARPPRHHRNVLKGVHPAIGKDDLVVMWGGGAWDWFDPVTAITAFKAVVERVPNAKLYFLGLELADGMVVPMKMARQAVETAEALGLAGTSVIFGNWAPYEDREAYLLESDIAISAARDLAETRLAFRSRVLDYLWAGLPVVTTEGDFLSDIVRQQQLGFVVEPGNVTLLAEAMIRLLQSPGLRADCSARASALAAKWTWTNSVAPLRALIRRPSAFVEARRRRGRTRAPFRANATLRSMQDRLRSTEVACAVQEQRAELHLGEVLDLLSARETDQKALAAAEQEIQGLRALAAEQQAQLDRIRSNPAFKAAAKVRREIRNRRPSPPDR